MTKRFSKVSGAVWRSKRFKPLSDEARLLYLYFLTSDHVNSIGCYSLPAGYAVDDLGWELAKYEAARRTLIGAELITFDEDTNEVFLERWFKHSPPMNASHAQGCQRLINEIEAPEIAAKVQAEFDVAEAARVPPRPADPPTPFPRSADGTSKWPVRAGSRVPY